MDQRGSPFYCSKLKEIPIWLREAPWIFDIHHHLGSLTGEASEGDGCRTGTTIPCPDCAEASDVGNPGGDGLSGGRNQSLRSNNAVAPIGESQAIPSGLRDSGTAPRRSLADRAERIKHELHLEGVVWPLPGCGNRPSAHASLDEESERIGASSRGSHQCGVEHGRSLAIGAVSPGNSRDDLCRLGCLDDECE